MSLSCVWGQSIQLACEFCLVSESEEGSAPSSPVAPLPWKVGTWVDVMVEESEDDNATGTSAQGSKKLMRAEILGKLGCLA
jgi:hypothetical protein